MNALKVISTVIAAIVPLLYFHGQAFYSGWLDYWGIPVGLFPIGMEEAILNGFIAYSILAIPYLLLITAYLLAVIGTLYNVHELSKFNWVNKLAGLFKIDRNIQQTMGHPAIALMMAKTVKFTFIVFSLFLFLFLVLSVSEKVFSLGKENASYKHQDLHKIENKTSFMIDGMRVKGSLILCSTQHCVILFDGKTLIIPVNGHFEAIRELRNESGQ